MDDDALRSSSNPQPPPLTAEEKAILETDKIGDTAYSKKWVLSVLLHMMEDERASVNVNDQNDESDFDENSKKTKKNESGSETETNMTVKNQINCELEQELCELWDMTMDSDVSKYLLEEDGIDLILDVIMQTDSLRKLEICMGILANMACTSEVCKAMMAHSTLSEATLCHIDNPDVRTLTELARFIGVCLSHKDIRLQWIEVLKSRFVVKKLIFILENSLNAELLNGVADIVDRLIDYDDGILEDLSTPKIVTIICDVYRRTAVKHPHTVQVLLHILQLFTTTEEGVSALAAVKDSGNIAEIILIQGSKYFTPLESNFPSLVSSCCVLNVLMSADNEKKLKFQKNDFKMLLTVMSLVEELLHNSKIKEDQSSTYQRYSEAVLDFMLVLVKRFIDAEISEKMVIKLKERKRQITTIISVIKKSPGFSSIVVKQLTDVLRNKDILNYDDEGETSEGMPLMDNRNTDGIETSIGDTNASVAK